MIMNKQQDHRDEYPMRRGKMITQDKDIRNILENAKTIAIVGLSPKSDRDSYKVGQYLQMAGYRIIPVRPAQKQILGEKALKSLDELEQPVDIINAFRNSAQIKVHAGEALRLKPKVFWMQLGIENFEAALMLNASGIDVVMNRCIKVDHARLFR